MRDDTVLEIFLCFVKFILKKCRYRYFEVSTFIDLIFNWFDKMRKTVSIGRFIESYALN